MTIDLRILPFLPHANEVNTDNFLISSPDASLLLGATESDINENHQLDSVTIPIDEQGHTLSFHEAEYLHFRAHLKTMYIQANEEGRSQIRPILSDSRTCLASFIQAKQSGDLARIGINEQDSLAWLQRTDQAFQTYLGAHDLLHLSLQTYNELPLSFRNHIAPNYFIHLAKIARADENQDGDTSLEEVSNMLQRENNAEAENNARQLNQLFNAADQNHDHFLDADEFEGVARSALGINDATQIQAVFNRLDTENNRDQKLSLDEFKGLQQRRNPSSEELRGEAQTLLLNARNELEEARNRIARSPESFQEIDRIGSRLSVFNLAYLRQLPDEIRNQHELFRILQWMQSKNSGENLIRSERVDELLQTRAMDIRPILENLETFKNLCQRARIDSNNTDIQSIDAFLSAFDDFRSHGIVSEEDLRNRILVNTETHIPNSLNLTSMLSALDHLGETLTREHHIPSSAIETLKRSIRNALGPLPQLAGREGVLSREKIDQMLSRARAEIRRQNPASTEEAHFFRPLWQSFEITKIENREHETYSLTEEAEHAIEGSQLLARALIQYAYLHPSDIIQTIQQTERNELLYIIEKLAEGLHEQDRAHAANGIPGIFHYASYLVHWAGVPLFRDQVIRHADQNFRTQREAIQALRALVQTSTQYRTLAEALPHLENPEHQRILRETLHVPEVENIYYIHNSREQEEAFNRFATYTLRRQINPENGLWAAFRNRFAPDHIESIGDLVYSPFQFRNTPGARSIYNTNSSYSEHAGIRLEAATARTDLEGQGGDLNPVHWQNDWSDDDESLDGIFDSIGQQFVIATFLGALTLTWRSLLGVGGPLAQWATGIEFAAWRNHPGIPQRIAYWIARTVTYLPMLSIRRELTAAEVEIVNARALRMARNTGGTRLAQRFWGFLNHHGAEGQLHRLTHNRNPQEAAARVLRLSQMILRESESCFGRAEPLLRKVETLSTGRLTSAQLPEIQEALQEARALQRQGLNFRQIASQQQIQLGVPVGESRAFHNLTMETNEATGFQRLMGTPGTQNSQISIRLREFEEAERLALNAEQRTALQNIRREISELERIQIQMTGMANHHNQLLRRGAFAAGAGIASLGALSTNLQASRLAGQMVNPALVRAMGATSQGNYQFYLIAWQLIHRKTLITEYRNNPSLEEWLLEHGQENPNLSAQELASAYSAHSRNRGSRAIYRNIFLSPVSDAGQEETIRASNLQFPNITRPSPRQ